jgi:hypothetical protein
LDGAERSYSTRIARITGAWHWREEALGIALDGKVKASESGKTGRGHCAYDAGSVKDHKGRFGLFPTLNTSGIVRRQADTIVEHWSFRSLMEFRSIAFLRVPSVFEVARAFASLTNMPPTRIEGEWNRVFSKLRWEWNRPSHTAHSKFR